jgi:hypothetical protein
MFVTMGTGGTATQFLLLGMGVGSATEGSTTGYQNIEAETYLVTVVEITEVTDLTNIGVFDEDAFNKGKVFG